MATPQYGVWWWFVCPSRAGRMPIPPPELESALSSPGPAWNDELAAAKSSTALVSWKAANRNPPPVAVFAISAIWVEFGGGRPTPRWLAATVSPSVSQVTMMRVSQSVVRPNQTFDARFNWPSWATAELGASTPVASAIAIGKASSTASGGERPDAGVA